MEHDETIKEFLIESYENLDRLDRDLVALEKEPRDRERLSSIFRTIHTLKGTVGFLGYSKLESVSHTGENLLSRLRDGELFLDAEITTALLAMVDVVRKLLASIEASGEEGDLDLTDVIAELVRLNARSPGETTPASAPSAPRLVTEEAEAEPVLAAPAPVTPPPPPPATKPVVAAVEAAPSPRPVATEAAPPASEDAKALVADSALRVDVGLLDKLMNLVGELVLARNQILQFTASHPDAVLAGATGRLNLVTSELQEGVMKTRMQPIGTLWSKFPRIVRDLATICAKKVRIEMEGKETDLDKTIIEAIRDPLTHIVRNSVDHGIESPDERIAKAKNPEGVIRLRAFHEGGQINIEISDDGSGIDATKMRTKAAQRGLITAEQAANMSDAEAIRLVFLPGFSTAATITNVSGRGVGMDVVRTNIEKIGGQVDIQTVVGEGTTLRIKIPLTLAIIPALIVAAGGDRYAIPQVSLLELVRLEGDVARRGIERIQDAPFYRLRGDLLPLVNLREELGVGSDRSSEVINIVVLQASDRQFGLVVEEIHDTEEIVVKPLGKQLRGVTAFAGATIMGDGKVALILDVMGIAQRASVVSEARDRAVHDAVDGKSASRGNEQALLVLRVGEHGRVAIPLSLVARLELFSTSLIEQSGDGDVIQYRDDILPLISLSKFFTGADCASGESRNVVVFSQDGRHFGLVVEQILDIVNESVTAQRRSSRLGVLGSAVVGGRVTELLDVSAIVRAVEPVEPTIVPAQAA